MRRIHSCTAIVTLLAFSAGCTVPPAPPPPPEPPTRYYSAAVQFEQTEVRAAAEDGGALTQDAAQLLHPGVKVAFYPPNACVTTPSEAGTGGAREAELIVMHCGALMSRLEAQAARARFEVVTWQALKHRDRPPLEVARELGVEVMFEVNELSIVQRTMGTEGATKLRFWQESGPGQRVDVPVGPEVAQRCQAALQPELARAAPVSHEAVLDAKAVEVRSGRALWFYKRATPEGADPSGVRGLALYYPAPGTIDWKPPPAGAQNKQQTGGGVMILASILGGVVPGAVLLGVGKSEKDDTMVNGGAALLGVGAALLVGGAVLVAIGNQRQRQVSRPVYPAPTYPPPEQVLCATQPVVPPWHAPAVQAAGAPSPTSASYTMHSSSPGSRDLDRERRERLVQAAADQFVGELGRVSAPR